MKGGFTMKQAKIFRRVVKNIYSFKLVDYPSSESYSSLIKEQKKHGYRQVIINSEIMIKIILKALDNTKIVLKDIVLQDSVDSDYREEIQRKIKKCNDNSNVLTELLTSLAWASEEDSIDIDKIKFAYELNDEFHYITIICNGVLSGSEINRFYNDIIEAALKESF